LVAGENGFKTSITFLPGQVGSEPSWGANEELQEVFRGGAYIITMNKSAVLEMLTKLKAIKGTYSFEQLPWLTVVVWSSKIVDVGGRLLDIVG
jgi:hypothetical protein